MYRKTLISSLLVTIFVVALVQHSTVVTAGGIDWSTVVVEETVETPDASDGDSENKTVTQKKRNGFVRALGAPFRAIGRFFGGGKKNDQLARRTNDKDASKFESTKVTRIKDATVAAPATTSPSNSTPSSTAPVSTTEFDSHVEKGRELLLSGNIDGAIAELSQAASINPKSALVNNLLGIAYESKGLRVRALESFEVAIHAEENNAEHLNNLGFLLFKDGEYEKATKYLKRAAKLSPGDARIWNNLAMTYVHRNKFDDAYESFVKAVGEYSGHMNMAAQLQGRGYAKDAIKHLEKAQAMRPNSVDALTKLVALYEMTGRPTDAETARRSIVALKTFADANK